MLSGPITDIPLQSLDTRLFENTPVKASNNRPTLSVSILRTDKTSPLISGNKWFKLKYSLLDAQQQGYNTLLSFGGPYSNHLHALAGAGKQYHFKTIGIIRGEEHCSLNSGSLNPTLTDLKTLGMQLYYINRQQYRKKHEPEFIRHLLGRLKTENYLTSNEAVYLIPEGGTNALAIKGTAEIAELIPDNTDYVCVACGTGGTLAGIIHGLNNKHARTKILGFPALKGAQFLEQEINKLLKLLPHSPPTVKAQKNWELVYDYHFGGFGKMTPELAQFIIEFEQKHSIPLDPVYTGKMMYGIVELINNNYFPPHSRILIIHSGGLQGRRGMEAKIKELAGYPGDNIP